MDEIFVQFEDRKQERVISVFGNPQDLEVYPNQGSVTDEDPRYLAFISMLPDILQPS
jgi:hypothetical protein